MECKYTWVEYKETKQNSKDNITEKILTDVAPSSSRKSNKSKKHISENNERKSMDNATRKPHQIIKNLRQNKYLSIENKKSTESLCNTCVKPNQANQRVKKMKLFSDIVKSNNQSATDQK